MAYKIERRGAKHAVIDETTGRGCGAYPSRALAVAAIEALGRKQRSRPATSLSSRAGKNDERLNGLTRSSRYRLAKGNPCLQMLLVPEATKWRRLDQRAQKSALFVSAWLKRKPRDVSASAWMAHLEDKQYMRRHYAGVARDARKEGAENAGRGTVIKEQLLALMASGVTGTKALGEKLGVSDSYIRRLKRQQ
jgi:hypothetical protein